jgi:hypothetical protein
MELQVIRNKIYGIRGCRVMLDFDLAEMLWCGNKSVKAGCKTKHKTISIS